MFQIGNKVLTVSHILGEVAFGVVYKVSDGYPFNVDILYRNHSAIISAQHEVEIMKQISHVNVIAMIGADQYYDTLGRIHVLILTEYCGGGNLNQRLNRAVRK